MKTVFNNSDVAHVWANKLQNEGRASNFFFKGDTIYSYGYHFAIAKHVTNENEENAVLLTKRSYSNSTAKHRVKVINAINHHNVILCNEVESSHRHNLLQFLSEINIIAEKLNRARKPENHLSDIQCIASQARIYANFFGVNISVEYPELFEAMSLPNREEWAEVLHRRAKELKAKRERQAEQDKLNHLITVEEFRSFEKDVI